MGNQTQKYALLVSKLTLSIVLLLVACDGGGGGARSSGGEGTGSLDGGAKSWIIGTWSGTYQNLNAASDSEQRETTAWIEFTAGDKQSGQFHLKLPQLEGVEAKGAFTDVNNQNLIFKVSESNLSSIGMAGTSRTFAYELAKDALILDNVRIKLILTREEKSSENKPDMSRDEADKRSDALTGTWEGYDQKGRIWQIKVFGSSRFTIEVRDSNKSTLWMTGVPRYNDDTPEFDAILKVDESAISDYIGLEYALQAIDGDDVQFSRLGEPMADGSRPELETFVCTKFE